ncbi:MAG: GUN4 domain-containing protein [Spirulinaceae cyanobacterium]
MNTADQINAIFKRIAENQQTEADIQTLKQLLESNDSQSIKQLGKYNVNISHGEDIHIGDRNYYTWDDEAIQALIKALRTNQENDFNTDYFRTIEACEKSLSLEQYFEDVLPKLRQQGSLEIRQNVFKNGRLFNYIATISDFELQQGMRGEALFMFSEFSSMQIKILQQYSAQCLRIAKGTVNSSAVGEAIYNFRVPTHACFAVAIVDDLDEKTATAIRTTNPINHRVNLLWYEIPVVCELNKQKLHFYEKVANVSDNFKGEIVWKKFRPIIQKFLSFSITRSEEYARLENLLASGRWREANEATRTIILKVAKREEEGYLTDKQIQNFPCQVLQVIDRLWIDYSHGHFGFSVQKRIFDECKKEPQVFGDRVGWYTQNGWISASQVSYTPANTQEGHLPWGIMQVVTVDNAALDAFVGSLRTITKTAMQQNWQKQLLADFMAFGGSLIGDRIDKEEFRRNLDYELSHNEAWWKGQRLEELKVLKLFSLLIVCPIND